MEADSKLGAQMRITHAKLLISIGLVVGVSACCLALQLIQRGERRTANLIDNLLTDLQSDDESNAIEAKAKLVQAGEEAIKPIVSLLQQLTDQERETTGAITAGARERPYDIEMEHANQRLDRGTRSRLKNYIYEILGRLHATEAVPLLINIMEREEVDDMIQGMSPVMRALAEIGAAAVPQLIESIENANSTALSFPEIRSALSEETLRRRLGWIQGRIELRSVLVLREIGDPRAISTLESLQTRSDNEFVAKQAHEAVQEIRSKTK
jgi:HEAT repeat protein